MLKITSNTKVYSYCPAGLVTGGAELLHQLTDRLNRSGIGAYLVYCGSAPHTVPDEYKDYQINVTDTIEDEPQNIIIYCETMFDKIQEAQHCQRLMWWLSIDNFYKGLYREITLSNLACWDIKTAFLQFFSRLCKFIKGKRGFGRPLSFRYLIRMGDMHGFQSEYAQHFLFNKGVRNLCALKDYIHTNYFTEIHKEGRENIVLYNPFKGFEFTKKLIAAAPDIQWVPIQGMTRNQIADLMQRSKLYIDFGQHPGKDRLPREAAMNGLCIITGRRGAADFFEDISIDERYKFNQHNADVPRIVSEIRHVLQHYTSEVDNFDYYRSCILREKAEFEEQVDLLFGISN